MSEAATAERTVRAEPALFAMIENFTRSLRDNPDAEAIRNRNGEIISRGELGRQIEVVAANLHARGLGPEDTIMFGVRPSFDSLVLVLAALRCGARLTFLEPTGKDVARARIALTQPTWVITESVFYLASSRGLFSWLARRKGLQLARLSAISGPKVHTGRWLPGVPLKSTSLRRLTHEHGHSAPPPDYAEHGSVVVFTSGTTGAPKGVVHDARSIPAGAAITDRDFELDSSAVLYTHKVQSFITVLERGGRAVVAPLGWNVKEFVDDVQRHKVTDAILVASQAWEFANYLRATSTPVPSSLRSIYLQAAPITVAVCERLHEVLGEGVRVLCIYGMTEILPVASIDSRDKVRLTPAEGDLVGAVTEGVEARVDEHGELHLRGANGFRGYLGHPDVDWHATGDLARIDDDGNIVLMGRAKDMLLRGGFNLYPGLYEDTICRIPGIGACAIVGVPDAETADERVVLFVEAHETGVPHAEFEQQVQRALRTGSTAIDVRALPDDVIVVDAIARSGRSSKIDRKQLRTMAAAAIHDS
ncbi:MAG: hypothetical protein JWN41_1293 [Thermoleophilia bacterium]|nr:hypothetical protein [Thermoleophilia bacterium]